MGFHQDEDEEILELLTNYLFSDISNLTIGWREGRSCECHNRITFLTWYYFKNPDISDIRDILSLSKHDLNEIINKFRYSEEYAECSYNYWHNQSRDVTDHADRFIEKPAKSFMIKLFSHYEKVMDGVKC